MGAALWCYLIFSFLFLVAWYAFAYNGLHAGNTKLFFTAIIVLSIMFSTDVAAAVTPENGSVASPAQAVAFTGALLQTTLSYYYLYWHCYGNHAGGASEHAE